MLKETYSFISFPLTDKDPHSVMAVYIKEFGGKAVYDAEGLRIIFAHVLRDYLEEKIGEWELGSLCFSLATDEQTKSILKQDSQLEKYVFDCVDIMWLSEGQSFSGYKHELSQYLKKLK